MIIIFCGITGVFTKDMQGILAHPIDMSKLVAANDA